MVKAEVKAKVGRAVPGSPTPAKKTYTYTTGIDIKVGYNFYDRQNNKFVVTKVKYSQTKSELYGYKSVYKKVEAVYLKNLTKKEKLRLVTLNSLQSSYTTYNYKDTINKNMASNTLPTIGFYSEKPVVKELDSYLNSLFEDKDSKPTHMTPIIAAIKQQIQEEAKFKKESDVTMLYDAIQDHFNGFIAKAGSFSNFVANVIVTIDWLGHKDSFSSYKTSVFEAHPTHNVIVINTRNKKKTFFINILKGIIKKYPTNGGK